MGYAYYEVTRRDGITIEAGYGVEAVCEEPGCTEEIDRGMAFLCGDEPGDPEFGCGGYFCGQHLYGAPEGEGGEGRCKSCLNAKSAADTANVALDSPAAD